MADHEDVDYPVLDERSLPAYLARMPEVASRLGGAPADWVVQEIGDGNVNFVFAVRGPGGDVCVKQALPYVRAVGAEWPLTPERTSFEYRALLEHGRYVAGRVPKPLHYDPHLRLLIVEYLGGLTVMRHGLVAGACYPNFAEHIGSYLAQSLFFTSDLALAGPDKRILMSLFHTNTEMCQIMEDMVFTEPYWDHPRNRCTSPQLDDERYQLQRDSRLKIAVARLKTQYLANAEALIHGDLHTGSIMVSLDDTRVIDQEFACYGPMGFDVGTLLAHLLINYFAQIGHGTPKDPRSKQQEWLLETVVEVWTNFRLHFCAFWETSGAGDAYPSLLFADPIGQTALAEERESYLDRLFIDTLGFCGAEIIRRIFGFAHTADFDTITDPDRRASCERSAIRMAHQLLVGPSQYQTITAVTVAARKFGEQCGGDYNK